MLRKHAGIAFTKMQGLGNDFVVIDHRKHSFVEDWSKMAQRMLDRHFGVGGDQLLLLCHSDHCDVRTRFFNVDGCEAEMCGNGVRCVGRYVYERQHEWGEEARKKKEANESQKKEEEEEVGQKKTVPPQVTWTVETLGGVKKLTCLEDGNIQVEMGVPRFPRGLQSIPLELSSLTLNVTCVDMGNPHAVTFLDDMEQKEKQEKGVSHVPLEVWGPLMEHHVFFAPSRTNFGVSEMRNSLEMELRVWERSAGATLACGTGACAAVAAAIVRGKAQHGQQIEVALPGGKLYIMWPNDTSEIVMIGPGKHVFEGVWPAEK